MDDDFEMDAADLFDLPGSDQEDDIRPASRYGNLFDDLDGERDFLGDDEDEDEDDEEGYYAQDDYESRFDEENDGLGESSPIPDAWQGLSPLIEPLLEKYGSVDAVNTAVQDHLTTAQQRNQAAEERLIAERLQHAVALGQVSPDAYSDRLQLQLMEYRSFKNGMATAIQQAAQKYPDADIELVRANANRPEEVLGLAERSHNRVASAAERASSRAVAAYIAKKAADARKGAPESARRAAAAPVAPSNYRPDGSFGKWLGGLFRPI